MWKRKSTPMAPKKKKLVNMRQTCMRTKTRCIEKKSENGDTSSSEHSAVTTMAPVTYVRVIGGTAKYQSTSMRTRPAQAPHRERKQQTQRSPASHSQVSKRGPAQHPLRESLDKTRTQGSGRLGAGRPVSLRALRRLTISDDAASALVGRPERR